MILLSTNDNKSQVEIDLTMWEKVRVTENKMSYMKELTFIIHNLMAIRHMLSIQSTKKMLILLNGIYKTIMNLIDLSLQRFQYSEWNLIKCWKEKHGIVQSLGYCSIAEKPSSLLYSLTISLLWVCFLHLFFFPTFFQPCIQKQDRKRIDPPSQR